MGWSCQSAFLAPVRLRTTPTTVFSIYMELPLDVEAELDSGAAIRTDVLYRECFIPVEGHFPLLTERLLTATPLSDNLKAPFKRLLQSEFSKLRSAGALGNIVVLDEAIHAIIKQKLDTREFLWPMEIAIAPRPSHQHLATRKAEPSNS